MSKIKIEINQDFVLNSESMIEFKVNTFYEKYLYYSENISPFMNSIYQLGSNLNGTPVNNWKEESLLMNFFIISDQDFDDLLTGSKSENVLFVEKLMNKQQTIIDSKENKISSKINVLRFSIFQKYLENRKGS
ncbi:hypothetical protein [Chishuiella sp.]|uniref:hypothetical protein n=1 Tax=Chishuiella sp. TaxID=1969467 RepID=UPI0028ADD38C|nr:hypothetical protein [Chishuiella sp.]